jgi:hypothetical protein
VTGSSCGSGPNYSDRDFATVKYDTHGVRQWVRRYDSRSHLYDAGSGIGVSPTGAVIVVGTSWLQSIDLPPDADAFVIAYSP